jgi:hypothetical protein
MLRHRQTAGWLISGFEMRVSSRYHLACGMIRPDAATSSATLPDRSARSADRLFDKLLGNKKPHNPPWRQPMNAGCQEHQSTKDAGGVAPCCARAPRLSPPNREPPPRNWKSATLLTNCSAPPADRPQRHQYSPAPSLLFAGLLPSSVPGPKRACPACQCNTQPDGVRGVTPMATSASRIRSTTCDDVQRRSRIATTRD